MCNETVDLSTDLVNLLHRPPENEGFSAGQKRHLSRQEFLRSYHFCVEETFKDKLTRYSLRLKDESFEEIVKDSFRKLIRAAKGFVCRRYENLVARKWKEKMNLLSGSCFGPVDKPYAPRRVLSYNS